MRPSPGKERKAAAPSAFLASGTSARSIFPVSSRPPIRLGPEITEIKGQRRSLPSSSITWFFDVFTVEVKASFHGNALPTFNVTEGDEERP